MEAAAAPAGGKPYRVAFLSTPSVYFSLPEDSPARRGGIAFDYDRQWEGHPSYRFFDFNDPEGTIEPGLRHTFDCAVVDPPFITRDVWTRWAAFMPAAPNRTAAVRSSLRCISHLCT